MQPDDRPHAEVGHVPTERYTDPDIFRSEMDEIFARMWVYLAHESQVPEPGDYVTTRLGSAPVIVSRSDDGEVVALLNRCIHRGATVCELAEGNARFFRCQYHGWTYKSSGEVAGITFPNGYGTEHEELRGRSLGRVETSTYRGFVFGRLVPAPESLEEHLGDAAAYLDRFVDSAPGQEVVLHRPVTRYKYRGNWKYLVENVYDGYHANFTHVGFLKAAIRRNEGGANPFGQETPEAPSADLGNGHGAILISALRLKRSADHDYGDSFFDRARNAPGGATLIRRLEERMGEEAARQVIEPGTADNVGIFPNLLLVQTQIRVLFPVAPDLTEIEAHATEWPQAPAEVNQLRLRVQEGFWGPAGMGVPDDLEMFERVQRGLGSPEPDTLIIRRGLEREVASETGPRGFSTDETALRGFHREWERRMSAATEEGSRDVEG